jgi:uncharacterized protein YfaS (alpha-2-macroglobulin family)
VKQSRLLVSITVLSLALNLVFAISWTHVWQKNPASPGLSKATYVTNEKGGGHIRVEFKTPMDKEGEQAGSPLVFTPALTYDAVWEDARTLVPLPKSTLPPGKDFVIKPAPELRDSVGKALAETGLSLSTEELSLQAAVVADRPEAGRARLSFKFNGAVNPVQLVEHLEILDDNGKPVKMDAVDTQPVYTPAIMVTHSPQCSKLRVSIRPGLRAHSADRGTEKQLELKLALEESIRIGEVRVRDDDARIDLICRASGTFSDQEVLAKVSTIPHVDFQVRPLDWQSGFRLVGDFRPKTFYKVFFKKGLRTQDGRVLLQDAQRHVVTENFEPMFKFVSQGPFFPKHRKPVLPIHLCNVETLQVSATRIYPNNLVAFFREGERSVQRHGARVGKLKFATGCTENTVLDRELPLQDLLGKEKTGIFLIDAGAKDHYWARSSRTVVWTNLGLSATLSPKHVIVRVLGLEDRRPISGCKLEILSQRNQSLGTAETDAEGLARIALDSIADEQPYLAVARKGDDLSFVGLADKDCHSLSVFDLPSRLYPTTAYEACVYTERGICRPGETIVVSAVVRDRALAAAGGFPAELRIQDPHGKLFQKQQLELSDAGFVTTELRIPRKAATGSYVAVLGMPGLDKENEEEWGRCQFRVGNYVPDRIRVELSLDKTGYSAGETVTAVLRSSYYFGKPSGGCKSAFRIRCNSCDFTPRKYRDFSFGNPERQPYNAMLNKEKGTTDGEGKASCQAGLPILTKTCKPPAALRIDVSGSVQESGGRAVSNLASAPLHVYPYYLGLKTLWKPSDPAPDTLSFAWVALDPAEQPVSPEAPLRYDLYRDIWRYVLTEDNDGNYIRKWLKDRICVSGGEVSPSPKQTAGTFEVACEEAGSYVLMLSGKGEVQTLISFWHSAGDGGGSRATSPAALEISTDRSEYKPGDVAKLSFVSQTPAEAMICTGTNGVGQAFTQKVSAGENTIEVTIPQTPYGSFYVGITSVRDLEQESALPQRLFGLAHLRISQEQHELAVSLKAANSARPGQTVPVEISLTNAGQPAGGTVQIMAVDEGILALTAFATPHPFAHFFGARRCAMQFSDMYDLLFPELPDRFGLESAAGGGAGIRLMGSVQPEQLEPAIVVLPPVQVPQSGSKRIELKLPDHTGALRLMAIAFNATAVGSTDEEMRLHNPITVQLTAPRAVAPGDQFEVSAQVFNHDVDAASLQLALSLDGPVTLMPPDTGGKSLEIKLAKGEVTTLRLRCRASDSQTGPAALSGTLRTGNLQHQAKAVFTVRPASPRVYQCGYEQIAPQSSKQLTLPGNWLADTGQGSLQVSTDMSVETTGAFAWLQQYPYGCLEQTTSMAFPLLCLPGLPAAAETGITPDDLAGQLEKAIQQIMLMELSTGGFSMWPGGRQAWQSGSVYAAHFLLEAQRQGIRLDPAFWERTLDFLKATAWSQSYVSSNEDKAYALYLLSCADKPAPAMAEGLMEDMQASNFSRFLAAAALTRGGRASQGAQALSVITKWDYLAGNCNWDMDSQIRRTGLALSVILEVMPESGEAARLMDKLRKAKNAQGHWGTTQNNALAVLALAKWARLHAADSASHGLLTNSAGDKIEISAGKPAVLSKATTGQPVTIQALGPGPLYCAWKSSGVPLVPSADALSHGMLVKRRYLSEDGTPATKFAHGDLYRVEITLSSEQHRENVVVVDLLPGCFEIEDSTLASRIAKPDKTSGLFVNFVERLDDRLLLFCSLAGKQEATFTYTVRAVSRGSFMTPRIAAEMMYDPEISASSGDLKRIVVEQ